MQLLNLIWSFWKWLSLRSRVAVILIFVTLILMISAFVYHFYSIRKLEKAVENERQSSAIKAQREINQAKEKAEKSAAESNKIIQTDSNKFSKDNKHLTNKFCNYYCNLGVLDSTCAEWAKENNRSCN